MFVTEYARLDQRWAASRFVGLVVVSTQEQVAAVAMSG
jgi:hypothetical protein